MTKFTKFMSLTLVLALTFAMTACGGKTQAPAEEPAAETEEAAEYNIAANLTDTTNEDGSRTVESDYFTLTLPLGDTWEYEVDDAHSITFYNTAARDNFGGRLCSLIALDPADTEHQNLPHYAELGEMGGVLYIVEYPSDVQSDIQNEKNKTDYEVVYAELLKIEEKAEELPVTLK